MSDEQHYLVLAGVDGSTVSPAVVDYASWISKTVDAPLKLLHTVEQRPLPVVTDLSGTIGLGTREELLQELIEVEQQRSRELMAKGDVMLETAEKRAHTAGVTSIEKCQRHGSLNESLIELEDKIRVLVLGIRGEEGEANKTAVGTQIESAIRSLHRPILIVNKAYSEPRKIMLAYDGSPASAKALTMIVSSPLFKKTECHIVHVGKEQSGLLEAAEQQLNSAGIRCVTQNLEGKAEEVIIQYQTDNQIDLTVMGAFSHHRLRDLLFGSFTAQMLELTHLPLLLLR